MMHQRPWYGLLLIPFLLLLTLAACAGSQEAEAPAISGPAFVLFYTDN